MAERIEERGDKVFAINEREVSEQGVVKRLARLTDRINEAEDDIVESRAEVNRMKARRTELRDLLARIRAATP